MKIIISFSPASFLHETSRCTPHFLSLPLFVSFSLSNRYCFIVHCRITLNGMKVSRPDVRIGRYRMIKHERDKHNEPNPQRYCIIVQTRSSLALRLDRSQCFCLIVTQTFPSKFFISFWRNDDNVALQRPCYL